MKIFLHAYKTVGEVKNAFHKKFPYLKLEFFREPHRVKEGSPKQKILPENLLLIDINGVMKEGEMNISEEDTVQQVEQKFQRQFNLPVQVFRKQNKTWIETTKTDQLTLKEQNRRGEEFTNLMKPGIDAGFLSPD